MDEQVLCYIDNMGESRFANIDASKVDSWLAAHPDCMPVYQFPVSRDTLRIDQQAALDYRLNCAKLGLSISDLDGVFMGAQNRMAPNGPQLERLPLPGALWSAFGRRWNS